MPNENCLEGLSCPQCGSDGPFVIRAFCDVLVDDEGTEDTLNFDWDDSSAATCKACYFDGHLRDYRTTVVAKLSLVVEVDYEVSRGAPLSDVMGALESAGEYLANRGKLTDGIDGTVTSWSSKVHLR